MQRKRLQNLGRTIDMKQYTVEITNEALADMDQLYNCEYVSGDFCGCGCYDSCCAERNPLSVCEKTVRKGGVT